MAASPTVLVLEDEAGARVSMAQLLKLSGYDAVTAGTIEEARALLVTTSIHALIIDVGLKDGGNGLDLLGTIRDRPEFAKAPIIVFTGGLMSPSEELLITKSRAFLFYKPEGFDTLLKFLDELTGRDFPH
jgi:DNA-binding response OmpR family regulator